MAGLRAVIAIGGGYGITALAVADGAIALARCGMSPSDAVVTAAMLGFPAYLIILMFGLTCSSLPRLLCGLCLWAALLALAFWLLDGSALA